MVGQVIRYLDSIEAQQLSIAAVDGENVSKIRAKIIIGRDGGPNQLAALRAYNGYLNRIEVLTFDQLTRTAWQVVENQEQILPRAPEDDVPF